MKNGDTVWVITGVFGIYYGTWRTRKEAIETHVNETGNGWNYCKSKGDSCVRAKIILL